MFRNMTGTVPYQRVNRFVRTWLSDADKAKEIVVPRYYLNSQITDPLKSTSLHAFGDASKKVIVLLYTCA